MTEAEYNRLRKVCADNARDSAIVELLLQTGIRLSELTRLMHDDVELFDDGGSIRIRGIRGRDERILPLNSKAIRALKAYLRQRPNTENPTLFLNRFGGLFGGRGVQKMLRRYMQRARLERASVHTLRHTFAAQQLVKGTSIKTVQEVMGHKDPRSTEVYISVAKEIASREIQDHAL